MSKYIDSNNYEINNNCFEVDDLIADSISLLNQKGYKTLFSCSGHVRNPDLYAKYKYRKGEFKPNELFEYYVINENDEYIETLEPYSFTSCYVMFDKQYEFKILPKGFVLYPNNIIDRVIYFYENGTKRKTVDIQKEIENVNQILLNWVKELK